MIERHPITDRASWLAMRGEDLTASDFAAAIGDSPFKTALELYAEKTGHLMAKPETALMYRGRMLEPTIAAVTRDKHPDWDVEYPLDFYIRDPEVRLGATPDALRHNADGSVTNLQFKAVNRHSYDRDWAEGPPPYYVYQTAVEGMLLDAEGSLLIALVVDYAGIELREFRIERHQEAEANFRQHARAFWDNVATGRRPPADLKRDARTLAALYPQSEPEPVMDLSELNELPDMLRRLKTYEAEIAARQVLVEEIKTYVKDRMGPAQLAVLPGWKLSWKTQHARERVQAAYSYRPLKVFEVKIEEEKAEEKEAAE